MEVAVCEVTIKKPRCVISFDSWEEYEEFESYAKSKCLDVKSFVKFASKAYMDKYPRSGKKHSRAVQPDA